jgi:hypothetical protein
LDAGYRQAVVGFKPTPPNRMEPSSSALDHWATLPEISFFLNCLSK